VVVVLSGNFVFFHAYCCILSISWVLHCLNLGWQYGQDTVVISVLSIFIIILSYFLVNPGLTKIAHFRGALNVCPLSEQIIKQWVCIVKL